MLNRRRILAGGIVFTAIVVTSCSNGRPPSQVAASRSAEASYPLYSSLTELSSKADVIVRGIVGGSIHREVDTGNERREPGSGIPMVFHRLAISEVVKGATLERLVVAWLDPEVQDQSASPLVAGTDLLLFMEELTREEAPGIHGLPDEKFLYVPLSADNGVFDVVGDGVRARSEALDKATFDLSAVRHEAERSRE